MKHRCMKIESSVGKDYIDDCQISGKSYHCALCNVLGRINGCAGCTFLEISSRAVGTVRAGGRATPTLPISFCRSANPILIGGRLWPPH